MIRMLPPLLLLLAAKPPCCLSANSADEALRTGLNSATALMMVMPLMLVTVVGAVVARLLRAPELEEFDDLEP